MNLPKILRTVKIPIRQVEKGYLRQWKQWGVPGVIFTLFLFVLGVFSPAKAQAGNAPTIEQLISSATHLMVFSPHPDDETLGAGGLIERVLKAGGKVRVVFMTDGEGYSGGVKKIDHISNPTAKDYRGYGALRREEALKATATLGMPGRDVMFLGFPDDGLFYLRSTFLSSNSVYISPATLEDRPLKSEEIIPGADYNGQNLIKVIERVIADFRPTLVATTPGQDWHLDHNSTYFFVKKALKHWDKKHPRHKPVVITFLIHFGRWPVTQGSAADSRLHPPKYFPDTGIQWVSFPLSPREVEIKRKAILEYRSQMLVMGVYLMSFARSNELYMLGE
ncbi:MAG: PIG-L family deacetylase [Syntrophobacteraceae bacterium]|nr:PIG-L family deacetylase [Syntrophobacteraceae bacterium]